MKGNRRLPPLDQLLADHKLETAAPPRDSLFWEMWRRWQPIAEATLALPYLQGIDTGLLNPDAYGGYNVADAYYCFEGAKDYAVAAARAPAGTPLQAFVEHKLKGYQDYNATFPDTWHVASARDVTPPQITRHYAAFEGQVVRTLDPVYSLVVMLPCEYLWAWLAEQMGTPARTNVYGGWITGNADPDGSYAMGNVLQAYSAAHPGAVDPRLAAAIYGCATYFEYANFAAATGTQVRTSQSFGLDPAQLPFPMEI
ncbi:MAG: hypothetical protein QNJ44_11875 [Rhodobacter sp.]|nr:hypothetical protein [Rhodobacter sp.]